jgi:diguanylate cyclase (GGDEF)-like protein
VNVVAAANGLDLALGASFVAAVIVFALVALRMHKLLGRMTEQATDFARALLSQESLEADLRHQVFHDALTGLANRALLEERALHALALRARSGSTIAICICDLDGFKNINDALGHEAGDQVLVAVAKRMSSAVRPGDTVARLGGDEFAVLLEDVRDPDEANAVAERMVSVMRQPIEVNGRSVDVSVSVGIAVADVGSTTEELFTQADTAMHEVKASGKDRFEFFEVSMRARILERLEITSSFESALRDHEFFLLYQPQFSLDDGHLEGFEALIRWKHPTLGLLMPDRFIGLAEETGQIVPIGRWVMETACEQAQHWSSAGREVSVSVNISARQLLHRSFPEDVRTALALSGLPAEQLVLEVAEASLVANGGEVAQVLCDLKEIGIRVAIDDFGTGYSSLVNLRQFPVDLLKIDNSFVTPLSDPNGEATAFVVTIVKLAQALGLQTVAEGVEEPSQRELLKTLGCDSAQGFLMARPLSGLAATDLVEDPLPGAGTRRPSGDQRRQ